MADDEGDSDDARTLSPVEAAPFLPAAPTALTGLNPSETEAQLSFAETPRALKEEQGGTSPLTLNQPVAQSSVPTQF